MSRHPQDVVCGTALVSYRHAADMPHADVNGIELYYETEGNGPPVILITGFGGDIDFWKRASEILSAKYTVIKTDNRGVGNTKYEGQFTLDDIAEDIASLIKKLDLHDVSIVGWSMGSHIAQKAVLLIPDRMTALVLVSSYRYRPARSKYILTSMLDAIDGGTPIEYFARMMNCMCYTEELFEKKERNGETVRLPDLRNPAGLRHQINAVELSDVSDSAGKIKIPTLLIHGDKDIMVDYSEGLRLAEAIPLCSTVIIKGAGHLIPADKYIPCVMSFVEHHRV